MQQWCSCWSLVIRLMRPRCMSLARTLPEAGRAVMLESASRKFTTKKHVEQVFRIQLCISERSTPLRKPASAITSVIRPIQIISLSFFSITEAGKCFSYFFELLCSLISIVGILIGMPLQCHFFVCFFDFIFRCFSIDSQHCVVITSRHRGTNIMKISVWATNVWQLPLMLVSLTPKYSERVAVPYSSHGSSHLHLASLRVFQLPPWIEAERSGCWRSSGPQPENGKGTSYIPAYRY